MNYKRIYNQIINHRIATPVAGYSEKHHIIPRCLNGSNKNTNIVRLSAREHFICHWLLVKIYCGNKTAYPKMIKAFCMMSMAISATHERKINSRIFERYRQELSRIQSNLQTGKNNSQAGTMWICNLATQENKKITNKQIPDGWVAGRNKWKLPVTYYKKKNKVKESKKYLNGYKVSVNNTLYDSISHAADSLGIGHETARMRFKSNNFPEYIVLSRIGLIG